MPNLSYTYIDKKRPGGQDQYYLHIPLSSHNEARYYHEQLMLAELGLEAETHDNEIIIFPHDPFHSLTPSTGTIIKSGQAADRKMGLLFHSDNAAKNFTEIFGDKFGHCMLQEKKIIYLNDKYLDKNNTLITSTLSCSKKYIRPAHCDVSRKYKSIKQDYSKKFCLTETIPNQRILPSDLRERVKPEILSGYSQDAAFDLYEKRGIKGLVTIFANGFCSGGDGEISSFQEESLEKISNASYGMIDKMKEGLVSRFGGIYKIANVEMKQNGKHAIMDYAFIAMPNMGDYISAFNTPSERNYFSRRSYLTHVILLTMLEFYLARFSNNILITGQKGTCTFGNERVDVAAIAEAVHDMPEFRPVEVKYALGKDEEIKVKKQKYSVHELFRNPPEDTMNEVKAAIDYIRTILPSLYPDTISKFLMENYCKGKETGMIINKIIVSIDNFFIDHNHKALLVPMTNFLDMLKDYKDHLDNKDIKEKKDPRDRYIKELKNDIREGMHEGLELADILASWIKRNKFRTKNLSALTSQILKESKPQDQDFPTPEKRSCEV